MRSLNIKSLSIRNLIQSIRLPRLFAFIITALLLCVGWFAPEKRQPLFPTEYSVVNHYSDSSFGGNSEAEWNPKTLNDLELLCLLRDGLEHKACGLQVRFYHQKQNTLTGGNPRDFTELKGLDLSTYEGIEVGINYLGSAKHVRIMLRNVLQKRPTKDQFFDSKILSSNLHPEEFDRTVYIPFEEFHVANWWIREKNIHRKQTVAAYDNIMEITFSPPSDAENGIHVLRLSHVTAVGYWLSQEQIYLSILLIWLAYGLFEMIAWTLQMGTQAADCKESLNEATLKANTDPLTDTLNRRGIAEVIEHQFQSHELMSIVIFDIDHFKATNDKYGHRAGDIVLKKISRLVQNNIRETDFLGRWGGEEFIVLSATITEASKQSLAEKLRTVISETPIQLEDGTSTTLAITVSCGCTYKKLDEDFETALERADRALFIAKHNGRNMSIDL